jgi:hypothetical protein
MNRLLGVIALFVISLVIVTGVEAKPSLSCAVRVYVQGKYFSGRVIRSYHTSCPFAQNVTRESLRYIIIAGGAGDGDFYLNAWSPVTRKSYLVHCFANGDISSSYGVHVDCRAGIGARVVYRAWKT